MILRIFAILLLAAPLAGQTERQPPVAHVAIVMDGPSERAPTLRALFLEEMRAVSQGDVDIQAPDELQLEADWSLAGVRRALDQVLADPRTDIVLALGVLASQAAAQRADLPKPVVAPFVTDPRLQDLPYQDGASGKKNLSYVSLDVDIRRDLAAFREIVPFTRLVFLLDAAILQAIPGLQEEMADVARTVGITVTRVPVAASGAAALAAIPADAQAAYVGPLPRLSGEEYARLADGLIARRMPSFAFEGQSDVERGLLVGVAPPLEMRRLARRVALNTQRILRGEEAGTLPVAFSRTEGLTLNMRTARAIGFSPSWRLLTSAELLHEAPEPSGAPLSLADAVREALNLNLDLRIAEADVAAGEANIRQARSALLPQIGLAGQFAAIEDDDARGIPGRGQRTATGSVTLEAPLYAEPTWANLGVQRHLQRAREGGRERVRLDIVLATAQTYLDVLRARTNERIQQDNLRLTRSNLALAVTRRRVGTAGPSEVYRWESEIANASRAVVESQAQTRVTEIALNALLHRPLEQVVATVEVGLDEPVLIASQRRLYALIANPASFRVFRDFVVQEGLAAVPELRQLDARIRAQERVLVSARRTSWLPSLSLRADRSEILARGGARGLLLPGVDDHQTTVALRLTFPLYTGGERGAQQQRATEELAGLRVQREAVAEVVEQRARGALHTARGALTAIRLSRDAANAAQANLDVLRDAYARGTVSILDLLDAQHAALVADLRAATGVYDFLRSLMEVERAVARFDFFVTQEEQRAWLARLERYLAERGVPVPEP